MSKQKISYLDDMEVCKEKHFKTGDGEIVLQMLSYEPEPTNCAIQIDEQIYDEFTSFDKCFRTYSIIEKALEVIYRG